LASAPGREFGRDQRVDHLRQRARTVHARVGRPHASLGRQQRQEGFPGRALPLQPCGVEHGGGHLDGGGGSPQVSGSPAEVHGVPGEQRARRSPPDARTARLGGRWTGDRRDGALRQQHPEDVVRGGAVDLRQRVQSRQGGILGQRHAGLGAVVLPARGPDPRIGGRHSLEQFRERQRCRRGRLSGGGRHRAGERHGREPASTREGTEPDAQAGRGQRHGANPCKP
jgi:hypothetical protein